ncbi:hypothetical protein [Amycolatopsis nalaikhensis]|uniref:Uncharacterized protein n=1 Tax=Amycolatopsis nalaikhensis TaxID=715472 RepID=A0ABY8XAC8_9PSEU|nr:hypothetical protein [Amycolatopsis sp. 2-2]WIV52931.1 hypothetical protein QP939_28755 [Amycolatopsis sp. 2-2]
MPGENTRAPVLRRQAELTELLRNNARLWPDLPDRRYSSIEALLLDRGRWFTPADLPPGRPRGPEQRCYANATLHSETYGLTYTEGFALAGSGLYAAHAWCVRPDGAVEDPTWGGDGLAYLGLPFSAGYLREHEARAGDHPVLFDQHRTGWHLLLHGLPDNALLPLGRPASSDSSTMPG